MNPWVLLGIAVAFGAVSLDDARLRVKIESMEAAEAKAEAAAEKRVNDAHAADAILTASLASQAEALKKASQEKIDAATMAFSRVVSNPACLRTDAASAFDAAVRVLPGDGKSPAGQPGAAAPKPH